MKYQPDYPGRFAGLLHARGWLQDFIGWHNDEHQHSGLALFNPADVFLQRVGAVHAARQAALDAYALHPERFPNGAPEAALPPATVNINPLEVLAVTVSGGSEIDSPNTKGDTPESKNASHAAAQTLRRETPAAAAVALAS